MERDGDVATEIVSCATETFALNFNLSKYKMCKDDICSPLFCSIPKCLVSKAMKTMDNITDDVETVASSNFSRRSNNYTECKRHLISLINNKSDLMKSCVLPLWDQTSDFCEFSPKSEKRMDELYGQNSFINGSQVLQTPIDMDQKHYECASESISCSTFNSTTGTADIDYEFGTNSSACIEGMFCVSRISNEAEKNMLDNCEKTLDITPEKHSATSTNLCNSPELNQTSPSKIDRIMPILVSPNNNRTKYDQEKNEVIDVADSPEMPTLIPFTSEVDEAFRVKIERVGVEKRKLFDKEEPAKDKEMLQPQVLLRRISFSKNAQDKNLEYDTLNNDAKNPLGDPEIEEIEGIRFFQFRSKQEMEHFNRKPEVAESDDNMIVPTKTTDITQIKGWRKKYFAHQSQFLIHNLNNEVKESLGSKFMSSVINWNEVGSSQNYLEVENNADHADNGTDSKNNGSKNSEQESNQNEKGPDESTSKSTINNSEMLKNDEGKEDSDSEDEDKPSSKLEVKGENSEVKNINNVMSAFVSEKLDNYLLKSSVLNVNYLEKINPNIIPIPPNASILSIGKLRKSEDGRTNLSKTRNFSYKARDTSTVCDSVTTVDNSPDDSVLSLDSTNESSSDDCSESKFKKKPESQNCKNNFKQLRKRQDEGNQECVATEKRKSQDFGLKQNSKRVILRLTKDGNGNSDDYKVCDISSKKVKKDSKNIVLPSESIDESSLFTSAVDSDEEKICTKFQVSSDEQADYTPSIIKDTLISNDSEFQILEEFLQNLTKYGTSNDVAMLVQSNRSYIDNEPNFADSHVDKYLMNVVSNAHFSKAKSEGKIKKTKDWQKNLRRNLNKSQKTFLPKIKKRKVSADFVEGMSGSERGKRSIRLPARYLDSAVLAAGTEWVSPVITIDDSPVKKLKRQSPERPGVHKPTEQKKCDLTAQASNNSKQDKSPNGTNLNKCTDKFLQVPSKNSLRADSILQVGRPHKKLRNQTSLKCDNSNLSAVKQSLLMSKKTLAINEKIMLQLSHSSSSSSSSSPSSSSSSSDDDDGGNYEESDLSCPSCSCSSRSFTYSKVEKTFLCPLHHRIETPGVEGTKSCEGSNLQLINPSPFNPTSNQLSPRNVLNSNFLGISQDRLSLIPALNRSVISSPTANYNTNVTTLSQNHMQETNVVGSVDNSTYVNVPVVNNSDGIILLLPGSIKINQNLNIHAMSKMDSQKDDQKTLVSPEPLLNNQQLRTAKFSPNVGNKTSFSFPNNRSKENVSLSSTIVSKAESNENVTNLNVPVSEVSVGANNYVESSPSNIHSSNRPTLQFLRKPFQGGSKILLPNANSQASVNLKGSTLQLSQPSLPKLKMLHDASTGYSLKHDEIDVDCIEIHSPPNDDIKDGDAESNTSIHENHHNYFKKQKPEHAEEELVDIDTVDESFNPVKQLKGDVESESDISDSDFLSTISGQFCSSNGKKKSLSERKRRLLLKIRAETLKRSSNLFQNCKSTIETLEMAKLIVQQSSIHDKLLRLAKKRLEVQNSLLTRKLEETIEGITPPVTRKYFKAKTAQMLSLDWKMKRKNMEKKEMEEKLLLSLQSKKSPMRTEDMEVDICEQDIDVRNRHISANIIEHDADSNQSGSVNENDHFPTKTQDMMRRRLQETMSKEKIQNSTKSDTGEGPLLIDLCHSPVDGSQISPTESNCVENTFESQKNNADDDCPKSERNYPSMIPLFHPRVREQAVAQRLLKTQSSPASNLSFEPNANVALNVIKKNLLLFGDETKRITSPSKSVLPLEQEENTSTLKVFEGCHSRTSDVQKPQELKEVTHAAVSQFGPCKVQEVQLSSGKTVFAYERHDPLIDSSSTNVNSRISPRVNRPVAQPSSSTDGGHLKEAYSAVCNRSKSAPKQIPEEITIDDSDEEVHEIDSVAPARTSNMSANQGGALNAKATGKNANTVKEQRVWSNTNNLNS